MQHFQLVGGSDGGSPPRTTLSEARKLLGRKYSHLDDDQVQDIINNLTLLARNALKQNSSKNHKV